MVPQGGFKFFGGGLQDFFGTLLRNSKYIIGIFFFLVGVVTRSSARA